MINNRGDRGSLGENDETLKLFDEPMLNNPVVRFINSAGETVAPRLENQWTPGAVFRGMYAALTAVGRPLPAWAESMVVPSVVGTAVFTMG